MTHLTGADSIFESGEEVRALRKLTFKSGKTIEIGDTGVVTKVPGGNENSPAQVKVNGAVFSIAVGDFESAKKSQRSSLKRDSSVTPQIEIPTSPEQVDSGVIAAEDVLPPSCQTVPVRLVQYIDYVGQWGDTMQKQRVQRLQKQLESAAGRLSSEAAAKFEEVAWLQSELEKWHNEASMQSKRADDLQLQLLSKDEEIMRLTKGISDRDAEIAWLKAELARKINEANAALADVSRLEGQLRATLEELKRLERVANQKGNDEADRRKDLDKRYEDMRNRKKELEDQLYQKMEELARAEQAIKALEQALRDGNLAFERAKNEWEQQAAANARAIELLKQQLAKLQGLNTKAARDASTQVYSGAAGTNPNLVNADNRVAEMKAKLFTREQQIAQLEARLQEADSLKGRLLQDLQDQLAQRDEYIRSLEAGTGANWRKIKSEDELLKAISDLEDQLKAERNTNDDLRSQMEQMKASYERKLREAERLLREAERRYKELEHLRDLLGTKTENAEEIIKRQLQEIAQLKALLADQDHSIVGYKARIDQLEMVIQQLQALLPKIHEESVLRLLGPLRDALALFPDRNPVKSPSRIRHSMSPTRMR